MLLIKSIKIMKVDDEFIFYDEIGKCEKHLPLSQTLSYISSKYVVYVIEIHIISNL